MTTHSTSTASDRGAAAARKKTMLARRLHFAPLRRPRVPLAVAADAVARLERKFGDAIRLDLVP